METTQGNSLCRYINLKVGNMPCFSYYLLCFSSTKSEYRRGVKVVPGGGKGVGIYVGGRR
jgi:hypothetical protein